MKTLLVLRHAKSDWADERLSDEQRPLAKRGRKDAAAVGRFLNQAGLLPRRVLASPARRVEETLELAMEAGGFAAPVQVIADLYGGDAGCYYAALDEAGEAELLLFCGHEPGCSAFVSSLIGGGSLVMATGSLAAIDCDVSRWAEVSPGKAGLRFLVSPRLLSTKGRS